jgi:anthranilate phosphoribosyltransferase
VDLHQARARVDEGGSLERAEARALVGGLFDDAFDGDALGAWLRALAARGETSDEIAGAADALRARMRVFAHDHAGAIDTCGTGGDGLGSFNVSTAAAIVAAGAGARVVKHGNRSQSSRCGSADLLEAAGIPLDPGPDRARRALDEAGITFLFAPAWHPLVARVGPVRKALGIRTLFNYLGPLCNPGRVRRQILGVPAEARVEPMARALGELGHDRAYVVHGAHGADELVPGEGNRVGRVGAVPAWEPADFAFAAPARVEDLRGGDARENVRLLTAVLDGERCPLRDAVVLNAAAALVVAGVAASPGEGRQRAQESIDSRAARGTLRRWMEVFEA